MKKNIFTFLMLMMGATNIQAYHYADDKADDAKSAENIEDFIDEGNVLFLLSKREFSVNVKREAGEWLIHLAKGMRRNSTNSWDFSYKTRKHLAYLASLAKKIADNNILSIGTSDFHDIRNVEGYREVLNQAIDDIKWAESVLDDPLNKSLSSPKKTIATNFKKHFRQIAVLSFINEKEANDKFKNFVKILKKLQSKDQINRDDCIEVLAEFKMLLPNYKLAGIFGITDQEDQKMERRAEDNLSKEKEESLKRIEDKKEQEIKEESDKKKHLEDEKIKKEEEKEKNKIPNLLSLLAEGKKGMSDFEREEAREWIFNVIRSLSELNKDLPEDIKKKIKDLAKMSIDIMREHYVKLMTTEAGNDDERFSELKKKSENHDYFASNIAKKILKFGEVLSKSNSMKHIRDVQDFLINDIKKA